MKPFRPEIPDRAGRGALCSTIQQVTRDVLRVRPDGAAPDPHELNRLLHRLDQERGKFHRLYGHKPTPSEETHG